MRVVSCVVFCCLTAVTAEAQAPMHVRARDVAADGRRAEAIAMLDAHLKTAPADVDARLVYGLLLSWEGRYEEARAALQQVLTQAPGYLDARVALMNVEWWAGNTARARELVHEVLARDPGQPQARHVLQRLDARTRPWSLGMGATRDTFKDTRDPWLETSLTLGRETAVGSLLVRGSRVERFGLTDTMVEVEAYPTVRPGTYAAVAVGFGLDDTLYPERRWSVDLYQSLGGGVEASVGYRQLQFTDRTHIYLGTLTKYVGNWMLTGRVFHVPDRATGGSWSYHGQIRRYFGARGASYLGAGYSYGLSREEPRGTSDLISLEAHTGRAALQVDLGARAQLSLTSSVSRQERFATTPQWQTTFGTALTIRF